MSILIRRAAMLGTASLLPARTARAQTQLGQRSLADAVGDAEAAASVGSGERDDLLDHMVQRRRVW